MCFKGPCVFVTKSQHMHIKIFNRMCRKPKNVFKKAFYTCMQNIPKWGFNGLEYALQFINFLHEIGVSKYYFIHNLVPLVNKI